jgi:hypothetical protein
MVQEGFLSKLNRMKIARYSDLLRLSDMNEDGKSGFLILLFNQRMFTEKLSLLMKKFAVAGANWNLGHSDLSKYLS